MNSARRHFIGSSTLALGALTTQAHAQENKDKPTVILPKQINPILFSCKYGMTKGRTIEERLESCKKAGFDGIDFDRAGDYSIEEIRQAAHNTGVFVHNAINHNHWKMRFTSPNPEDIATAKKNLEHCIRVSHAAGGSAVLIVVGKDVDGDPKVIESRARQHLSELLPLAGALGQHILIENVWNGMSYQHGGAYDQSAEALKEFIDSFKSPWIGSYFDVGNHHRYGNMGDWLRTLNRRVIKLDLKGYHLSKAKTEKNDRKGFCDITEGDIDWKDVRKALREINFHGWSTAEVGGGDTKRLSKVLSDMKRALLG